MKRLKNKKITIFTLIALALCAIFFANKSPKDFIDKNKTNKESFMNFNEAKKLLLKRVYFDHQVTFYCDLPYEVKEINGKERIILKKDSAKYTPRKVLTSKGKLNDRIERLEWEHIMPAENFGRQLSCWRDGSPDCVSADGKIFKGRKCCRKVSPLFNRMEADMNNLVPEIGEVNGDRSNYRYAELPKGESLIGQYGKCQVKIDFENKRIYPRDEIKGEIARAYLYMSKTYDIRLSKQVLNLMNAWN